MQRKGTISQEIEIKIAGKLTLRTGNANTNYLFTSVITTLYRQIILVAMLAKEKLSRSWAGLGVLIWTFKLLQFIQKCPLTLASLLTVGLLANCTSVALSMVFSSNMVA